MTASHNAGGPNGDFGVKYNISNGGAAPEAVTNAIFDRTLQIDQYLIDNSFPTVDVSQVGRFEEGGMIIDVVDPAEAHVELLKNIFDFPRLKSFLAESRMRLVYDGMHGVAGPTARRVFVEELSLDESCLANCVPQPDFAGGHPDPNLTYAHDLVECMGLGRSQPASVPDFGAAADGDMDRNMILGANFFVTPSDSVAIIAAYAKKCIPYFMKNGLSGVARSMPTSGALDRVAAAEKLDLFETPTGWKFFGNLLDAGKISICGEESFGTGADHVREKDGMWAVLAWLSIIEYCNRNVKEFVSVKSIVEEHWRKYGRNYYTRYGNKE